MTSTNSNVGLKDATRPSSRVLRPPGGGHTDIFGAPEPPVRKDSGRNASSILEGTNCKPEENVVKPPPRQVAEVQPEQPQQPRAGKVPPGGFSSGLW